MSNAIVPINPSQLPAAARARMQAGQGIAKNFVEGVGVPIDILSIRGKNFRERVGGEEIMTPRPMYEYDVVILDGTPGIGKTYYINPYVDGSMAPPDCWSLNGIKPDPQSPALQSPTCRGCRWNVFGSRITTDRPGQQSKAKACADSRRVAVFPAYKLTPNDGSDPAPMLLRIPATSLVALKTYATELERMGIPANAVVTRLGFDHTVTHPQLTFAVVAMLNDSQFSHVEYLLRVDANDPLGRYEDERVRRILEAPPPGEDIDPSETQGVQITNRNDAPPVQPAAAAPASGQWQPGQPTIGHIAQATGQVVDAQPMQQAQPAVVPQGQLIKLPDGRWFDPVRNAFVEAQAAPPARPATVIDLPDGQHFDTATGQFWVAPGATADKPETAPAMPTPPAPPPPAPPISERAKASPPASAPAGQAGAPQGGWKPAAVQSASQVPGPGWRPPLGAPEATDEEDIPGFLKKGNGQTIEATATEVHAQPAATAAPTAKKRKPAPPAGEATGGAQEAPQSLDALLSDLDLQK